MIALFSLLLVNADLINLKSGTVVEAGAFQCVEKVAQYWSNGNGAVVVDLDQDLLQRFLSPFVGEGLEGWCTVDFKVV